MDKVDGKCGALLALGAAIFIVIVEGAGQYFLRSTLDPQLEQLRASFSYSQEFYRRQLGIFEAGFTKISDLEISVRLVSQGSKASSLDAKIRDLNSWKERNEFYMSDELYRDAGAIIEEASFVLRAFHNEEEIEVNNFIEMTRQIKLQLRNEARNPEIFL